MECGRFVTFLCVLEVHALRCQKLIVIFQKASCVFEEGFSSSFQQRETLSVKEKTTKNLGKTRPSVSPTNIT